MQNIRLSILAIITLAAFYACKGKEENPNPNEENELITTIRLVLQDDTGKTSTFQWRDLTPNDPAGRTIDTIRLADSSQFTGRIEFWDETKNPAVNITPEVEQEGKDHLVVYKLISPLAENQMTITRTDRDSQALELGLKITIKTKAAGQGGLQILLRHQPGVKDGTESPGDSDVDISLPVLIF